VLWACFLQQQTPLSLLRKSIKESGSHGISNGGYCGETYKFPTAQISRPMPSPFFLLLCLQQRTQTRLQLLGSQGLLWVRSFRLPLSEAVRRVCWKWATPIARWSPFRGAFRQCTVPLCRFVAPNQCTYDPLALPLSVLSFSLPAAPLPFSLPLNDPRPCPRAPFLPRNPCYLTNDTTCLLILGIPHCLSTRHAETMTSCLSCSRASAPTGGACWTATFAREPWPACGA
jgi:hypothetical protein